MGMLTLGRRKGETIVVGGNITVTVVKICGNEVKLRVQAPEDVTIHRGEIQAEINKEMEEKLGFTVREGSGD